MTKIPDISDMIGKPYEELARGPGSYDCVGLVLEILRRSGAKPTDWILDNAPAATTSEWRETDAAVPMCVIQSSRDGSEFADHLSVYIGGGMVIHATENGVEISSMAAVGKVLSIVEYRGE